MAGDSPTSKREPMAAGQRYGHLVAIERIGSDRHGKAQWRCKCDCGGEHFTGANELRTGNTKSCGCVRPDNGPPIAPDQRYGRLVAVNVVMAGSRSKWQFRCDCGNEHIARTADVRSGKIKSCGCFLSESRAANGRKNVTHGMKHSLEYHTWVSMKQRCTNPNDPAYSYYGGRGITVCERWLNSFEHFLADMGQRPTPDHSLDRYPDNDRGYEPGNCRWATPKEQAWSYRGKKRNQ